MKQGGLAHKFAHQAGLTREERTVEGELVLIEGMYITHREGDSASPIGGLGVLSGDFLISLTAAIIEDVYDEEGGVVVQFPDRATDTIPMNKFNTLADKGTLEGITAGTTLVFEFTSKTRAVFDYANGNYTEKVEITSDKPILELSRIYVP